MKNSYKQKRASGFVLTIVFLLFFLFLNNIVFTQIPEFLWVKRAGGIGNDCGRDIANDSLNNSIIVGYFQSTANFDTIALNSTGGWDIFIAKYNPYGNVLWAKSAGGLGDDLGYGVSIDALGNSIITGYFEGTATFGTIKLTSAGLWDIFIAKYDSSGKVLWAKKAGGTQSDNGNAITTDITGNVIITGFFGDKAKFDATTLTTAGEFDIFVAKYDMEGNFLWAKQAGGISRDFGIDVDADGSGKIIVTGFFTNTAIFGTVTLTSNDKSDIFISKYDDLGNVIWAKQAGGTDDDIGSSIISDNFGNIFVTGEFKDTAIFSTTTLLSAGQRDIFIAKYDALGNALWARRAGGSSHDIGSSITIDGSGNSIITGQFSTIANFDTISLTSFGSADIFIAKYNSSGRILWAKQAGGLSHDPGFGVATVTSDTILLTGGFGDVATFDKIKLTGVGAYDIFVAKVAENNYTDLCFRANPNGFDFGNFSTNHLRTWEMFKVLMGEDACEINGRPRPEVYKYFEEKYKTLPGACVGMSGASLINYFDIDQSNIAPFDMQKYDPLYQGGHNPDKDTSIAYYHGTQIGLFFQLFRDEGDPNYIFDRIKSHIQNKEPFVILEEGHCIVPCQYTEHFNSQGGLGWVRVYDCNYHGNNNLLIRFDLTNNTWEYTYPNGVSSGNAQNPNISLAPISFFTITGIPYWMHDLSQPLVLASNEGDNYFSIYKISFDNQQTSDHYHLVYGDGPAHFLFTDKSGNRLGYDDIGNFYDEIEGAFQVIKYGNTDNFQQREEFILPAKTNYRVAFCGSDTGLVNFTAIGNGFFAKIRNVSMSDSTIDKVCFGNDGSSLIYSTNDLNKNYSVTLDLEFVDKSRSFHIDNTSITKGDTAKFYLTNNQTLKYTNIGCPKNYDLTLVQVGINSLSFSYPDISLRANETHILTPVNWQALDTTEVILEIDRGNDGSIDSSANLSKTTNVDRKLSQEKVNDFSLSQNYPNPFNSQTTIDYQLPQPGHVLITIYNAAGQQIIKLVDEDKGVGHFTINWEGKDVAGKNVTSGIYFYKIEVTGKENSQFIKIKKMLYLK